MLLLGLTGSGGLIWLAKYQDRAAPEIRAKVESQRLEEREFLKSPFRPEEIGRTIPLETSTMIAKPEVRDPALKIYSANCTNCHGATASGGPLGPSLVRLVSERHWTREFLANFIAGHSREPAPDSMPRFTQLSQQQCGDLAGWLLKLRPPAPVPSPKAVSILKEPTILAEPAKKVVEESIATPKPPAEVPPPPEAYQKTCSVCHGDQAQGNIGPSLIGITNKPQRSFEDLLKLLDDPRAYGLNPPMPAMFPKLTPEDKNAIVEWLSKLK
jgi:mono/diheme cytochrome c family protein